MPTYDYVCEACGQRVEVMHGVHAERPTTCQACGGPLRRAVSAPAIVFKGSGWAKLDARNKSTAGTSADKSSADAAKPSDSASAPEAKPASTAPAGESTSSPASSTSATD